MALSLFVVLECFFYSYLTMTPTARELGELLQVFKAQQAPC
jgi:hypothetical protein